MIDKEYNRYRRARKIEINYFTGFNDGYEKGRRTLKEENAELKKELKKWKKEWQEQVQKATDEGYTRTLQTIQLTNAKELLKKVVGEFYYLCEINNFATNYECLANAEQFLRETDIDNAIQQANEGLDFDKIANKVDEDLRSHCPYVLCEDCNKEDCGIKKLGLVEVKTHWKKNIREELDKENE